MLVAFGLPALAFAIPLPPLVMAAPLAVLGGRAQLLARGYRHFLDALHPGLVGSRSPYSAPGLMTLQDIGPVLTRGGRFVSQAAPTLG